MKEDQVRVAMATVETALEKMTTGAEGPELVALQTAWTRLVNVLALGPAPRMRDCPHCARPGRANATLCGFCWSRLVPTE